MYMHYTIIIMHVSITALICTDKDIMIIFLDAQKCTCQLSHLTYGVIRTYVYIYM